jgi:hypothetical protein
MKDYTIEERETGLVEEFKKWLSLKGVKNITTNTDGCVAAFEYCDVKVILMKVKAFEYVVYGGTKENGIDAMYRFNTENGIMIMVEDKYLRNRDIEENVSGPVLTDVFGGIRQYFNWLNKPIHVNADEDLSKRKTFDDFLDLLKSGKLFEGEMEVDDDE